MVNDDPEKGIGPGQNDYADTKKDETTSNTPASLESRSRNDEPPEQPPAINPQSILVEWEPNDPDNPQNLLVHQPPVVDGLNTH